MIGVGGDEKRIEGDPGIADAAQQTLALDDHPVGMLDLRDGAANAFGFVIACSRAQKCAGQPHPGQRRHGENRQPEAVPRAQRVTEQAACGRRNQCAR